MKKRSQKKRELDHGSIAVGGRRAKHGTPNIEHPTSNIQLRLKEESTDEYGRKPKQRNPESVTRKKYNLEERLLVYAVRIVRLVDVLPSTRVGRDVSDQLLRCGSSPLANHGELQAAEFLKDFVHKLKVCLKELRGSCRWLRLVHRVPLLPPAKVAPLLQETDELIKIFAASLRTAKSRKG